MVIVISVKGCVLPLSWCAKNNNLTLFWCQTRWLLFSLFYGDPVQSFYKKYCTCLINSAYVCGGLSLFFFGCCSSLHDSASWFLNKSVKELSVFCSMNHNSSVVEVEDYYYSQKRIIHTDFEILTCLSHFIIGTP